MSQQAGGPANAGPHSRSTRGVAGSPGCQPASIDQGHAGVGPEDVAPHFIGQPVARGARMSSPDGARTGPRCWLSVNGFKHETPERSFAPRSADLGHRTGRRTDSPCARTRHRRPSVIARIRGRARYPGREEARAGTHRPGLDRLHRTDVEWATTLSGRIFVAGLLRQDRDGFRPVSDV